MFMVKVLVIGCDPAVLAPYMVSLAKVDVLPCLVKPDRSMAELVRSFDPSAALVDLSWSRANPGHLLRSIREYMGLGALPLFVILERCSTEASEQLLQCGALDLFEQTKASPETIAGAVKERLLSLLAAQDSAKVGAGHFEVPAPHPAISGALKSGSEPESAPDAALPSGVGIEQIARTGPARLLLRGVITMDEHGFIRTINQDCRKLLGYSPAEVLGWHLSQLLPDELQDPPHVTVWELIGRPFRPRRGVEMVGRQKGGASIRLMVSISDTNTSGKRIFVSLLREQLPPGAGPLPRRVGNRRAGAIRADIMAAHGAGRVDAG